jgi:O-antigen ligase
VHSSTLTPGGARQSGSRSALVWGIVASVVYLGWGAARARAFAELMPGSSGNFVLPEWLGAFLVLVAPVVLSYGWGLTILPYTIPLADTPQVPYLRFLEELSQFVIVASVVGFCGFTLLRRGIVRRSDLSVVLALWFLVESLLSFGVSHFYFAKDEILLKDGITRIALIALFFLMIWLIDQRVWSWAAWERLMATSCQAAVLAVLMGLFGVAVMLTFAFTQPTEYQWSRDTAWGLAYFNRFKGTLADPSQAGIYYAAVLPLALLFVARRLEGELARTLAATAIGTSVGIVVLATGSRAGLAALAASVLFVLLGPSRRYGWGVPVVGLLTLAVGLTWARSPFEWYAASGDDWNLFFEDPSRQYLLRVALGTLATFPIFGIGPGIDGKYGAAYDTAHNTLVSLGVEQGMLGVLIFVALVGSVLVRLVRVIVRDRQMPQHAASALLAGLLAIVVGGQFHTTLKYPVLWFLLGLAITLCRLSEGAVGPMGRVAQRGVEEGSLAQASEAR